MEEVAISRRQMAELRRCVEALRRALRSPSTPDAERDALLDELHAAVEALEQAHARREAGVTPETRRARVHRFLGEVSEILSASLDYEATVGRIAELCVRVLADSCAVFVRDEDGAVRGLGFAAVEPGDRDAMTRLAREVPAASVADDRILSVLATGEPLLMREVPEDSLGEIAGDAERETLLRELEVGSLLSVPLVVGGRALGVLVLGRRRGTRPFGPDDQELARELAARAAHAVDNARLYREAQKAARVQEETLGVVSHDLGNALNAALTNADLLLEIGPAYAEGSRERRQLEAVRRSLHHMHRLVHDLLDVDRLERARFSLDPARLRPATLVEELNGLLGPLARDAGLHWEVDIPDATAAVEADAARLIQVFANLVGNAVKATRPGGRVSIRAVDGDDEVRFEVADTGGGIEAEHLPRLFDRFFQVPSRSRGGSGLGLTIARGIVEAHGGRMWVASEPGVGTTFSFSLPHAP